MLTSLKLSNFKCFDSLSLPLAPLVLLTGFNAAGKSTTLQSLLLLAQAFRFGGRSPELNLNGPLVRLGTSGEVMSSGKGDIIFAIEDEVAEIEWTFQATDRIKGISIHLKSLKIKTSEGIETLKDIKELEMFLPNGAKEAPRRLVQRLRDTIFLSAIRIGISEVFPSPEEASPIHADVGVQGEFAPWWFQRFLDEDIEDSRCHP
ncbi:AAA family ATPase, partial [Candidatus Babeliales bacterium]|nr:AAA family ATPase [Candidatus Babeliales bacterium]